jgi:hypothetical protein
MAYNMPGQDEKPLGRSKYRWKNNINVFNVICLGKMKGHSRSKCRWKDNINNVFKETNEDNPVWFRI